ILLKISLNRGADYAISPEPRELRRVSSVSASTGYTTFTAIAAAFKRLCEKENSARHHYSLGLYIKIGVGEIHVPRRVRTVYIYPIAKLFNTLDENKRTSNRVLVLIFDVQSPLPRLAMEAFPMPKHIYHLKALGLGCTPFSDRHTYTFWKRVLGWAKRENPPECPEV
ncbi:hypothetical protein GGF50DRAFT_35538, partial [Schizophyllum commune]